MIAQWIREGALNVTGDNAVIGSLLAEQLGIQIHDKITLYGPKDFEKSRQKGRGLFADGT